MCGIGGFIGGNDVTANADKLRIILLSNESRGKHSTGVYGTARGGYWLKDKISASEMIKNPDYDLVVKNSSIVLLHTRWATTGAITPENAHPFRFGDYVGTHNGWINNWRTLVTENELIRDNNKPLEVDSEVIYALMDKKTPLEAIPMLEGEAALAWIKDDNLFLYRKASGIATSLEKPLYCGLSEGGFYYSSLREPLEFIGCKDVKMLPAYRVFTVKKEALRNATSIDDVLSDVYSEEVHLKKPYTHPVGTYSSYNSYFGEGSVGAQVYGGHLEGKKQEEGDSQKKREKLLTYTTVPFPHNGSYFEKSDWIRDLYILMYNANGFSKCTEKEIEELVDVASHGRSWRSLLFDGIKNAEKKITDEAYSEYLETKYDSRHDDSADTEGSADKGCFQEKELFPKDTFFDDVNDDEDSVNIPEEDTHSDFYLSILQEDYRRLLEVKEDLLSVQSKKKSTRLQKAIETVEELLVEKNNDIEEYIDVAAEMYAQ